MVTLAALAIGGLCALAFVLAPLVRNEADIEPIRRPRPGTRHLHGLDGVDVDLPDAGDRRCHHCGAAVEEAYTYCGECSGPLP